MPVSPPRLRLNIRALIILLALVILAIPAVWLTMAIPAGSVRSGVLAQARALDEAGKGDLAARHLDRYLAAHPDDIEVIDALGRILSHEANSPAQLLNAAKYLEQAIRLDPKGAKRQDTRRDIADMYIRYGDYARLGNAGRSDDDGSAGRYLAAEAIARQRIELGADGPADHLLLARALEGMAASGNEDTLKKAVEEYNVAHRGDPGDIVAAERLARLYQDRLKQPAEARRVLDELAKAKPEAARVHLVRFAYFARLRDKEQARKELDEAVRLEPKDPDILLIAAGEALRRGEPAAARALLAALPEGANANLRVRLLRGMVELGEQKNDDAIELWRNDLILSGGTDADMTWWLTYVMLNLGRVAEARPMLLQYRRIAADDHYLPRVRFLQGLMHFRSGRPTAAIEDLEWARGRLGEDLQDKVLMALGRCYEAIGDQERALKSYQKASELFPEAPAPRLAAVALLQETKFERAVAELRQAIEIMPAEPQLRLAMAGLLMKQQAAAPAASRNWAPFDDALARAAAAAPGNPALALLNADRLMLDGQASRANDVLSKLAQASPKSTALWLAWAESLARAGQLAEALTVLDKAAAADAAGDNASLRIARSKLLVAMRRGTAAAQALSKGAEGLPVDQRASVAESLGALQANQGDPAAAHAAFLEWAGLVPGDVRPPLAMMKLALDTHDTAHLAEAEAALRKVLAADKAKGPDPADKKANKKVAGAPKAAQPAAGNTLELIDDLLVESPRLAPALIVRARLLERDGKSDEAIAAYYKARELGAPDATKRLIELLLVAKKYDELEALAGPRDPRFRRLLAEAFFQVGQPDRSLRQVELSAESDADTLEARSWQAQMFERLKLPARAEAAYRGLAARRPSELDPWLSLLSCQALHKDTAGIKATLGEIKANVKADDPDLLAARCARAVGDPAAAEKAYRAALARRPDDGPGRVEAATYMQQLKRPAEAARFLKGASADAPAYKAVARQIALSMSGELGGIGNRPDALAFWQNAWDLLGDDKGDGADPEDRLVRAILVSRSPDAPRREKANAMLERLAADLPVDAPVAAAAREYLAKILLLGGDAKKGARVASVTASLGNETPAIALYAEALYHAKDLDEAERQLDRLRTLRPGDPTEAFVRARIIRDRAGDAQAAALEKAYLDRGKGLDAEPLGRQAVDLLLGTSGATPSGPTDRDVAAAERIGRAIAASKPGLSWIPAKAVLARKAYGDALELAALALESDQPADRAEGARIALAAANAGGPEALAEADKLVAAAVAREPRQIDNLSILGMIRHKQGRFDDEIGLYRDILAIAPENGAAANNLAWALSEGANRPAEGLELIDRAIAQAGPIPQFLDTRGAILTRLGRYDAAIKDLETAGEQSPVHLFHLARVYQKAGRVPDAKKAISLAKKIGLIEDRLEPAERPELKSLLAL
jgi:tetratricopeptide (TPR) repeat protein